jgi:long-chain fatty acid transport protein
MEFKLKTMEGFTTMGFLRSFLKISAFTLLISQAFFSSAFAAGFQLNEISPSLQGDATAGSAAADNDVSSMFTNPATLSTLIQNQAYLGGSEIMPHLKMNNATAIHTVNIPGPIPTAISAPVAGETSQSSVAKSAFAPDGYFGWRINDRMVVGIAVVAPFGLTTSYDNGSVLRFIADNSTVETININPSFSWALTDQVAIGIGFQAQYIQASFSNFDGPYTGIAPIDTLIASTHATYVNGSGWGYGYTLGALWKPDELTRLGVGFRSQISEQIGGNGRQFTSPGGVTPAPSQAFLFNAGTSDSAAIKTPGVVTLSAARDIRNWTVKASVQYNLWNCFNQLSINMPQAFAINSTITTKWNNSWFGALGADYHINPKWTVRAGVAYDETPTRDAYRDPRIPDSDRVWLTGGATYKVNKHFGVDGVYEHIFFANQSVNVTQGVGSSVNSTLPLEVNTVTANYRGSVDIVGLAARYSF